MILDTPFLIDLFDGREGAFENSIELTETKTVQRVPSPVITELSYGGEFGDVKYLGVEPRGFTVWGHTAPCRRL